MKRRSIGFPGALARRFHGWEGRSRPERPSQERGCLGRAALPCSVSRIQTWCGICVLVMLMPAGLAGEAVFEMPMYGQRLPTAQYELVNRIPKSRLARLPDELPVFRVLGQASQLSP